MKRATVRLPRHALPTPSTKGSQEGRATSGHHAGRPACSRRDSSLISKPPVLRLVYLHLAHKMALTERLCFLLLSLSLPPSDTRLTTSPGPIQRRTATYWNITSSSHTAEFPSSPALKLSNQLDPAGFRQLGDGQRQHNWRQVIFSNKSLRFWTPQFSLLPRIFHISWKT